MMSRTEIYSQAGRWIFKRIGRSTKTTDHSEEMRSFFERRLSGNFLSVDNTSVGNTKVMEDKKNMRENDNTVKVRTIFLSDMHLGTRSCRADLILSFLKKYETETLYLVGDIIDGWRLKKSWYWPELHEEVLQTIMAKTAKGNRVVYIPGNHDDFLRLSGGKKPTGVEVTETAIHITADGKRFLVMHGDQLDEVMRNIPWLAHVGDIAYDALTVLNLAYNKLTGLLGFKYRSIAALA